ncbi:MULTISPECIES: hypothetical protein [unclassified Sphingopyxis]|uniref:hypothetical protein n=1 Tax=unclassified Sphingopyxis TaxID=2614943 RepID=UPI0007376DC4|nr:MULTISPECIES: hypothetical protein [unclassified Sphingopyxis]KTE37940.1 hypothetical protein ATE62_12490 [Sphingopyxis sp. HIX]KTE75147.1 hypothetical protein ATE72_21250 [Sphingopyxis sp. HXXIV]
MVFDLRRALLSKEEKESSRLMDFEFRQRARSFRLIAEALGRPGDELVRAIALSGDEAILDRLVTERGIARIEIGELYARCRAEAYRQLVEELGDPTPHRLG